MADKLKRTQPGLTDDERSRLLAHTTARISELSEGYPDGPADAPLLDEDGHDSAPRDYRAAVVDAMRSQLGNTDPAEYWIAVHGHVPTPAPGKRIHWCGAVALWSLHMSGLCTWRWGFSPDKPGFIWRLGWRTIKLPVRPEPGDICYCERAQHHAIVERVDGNRVITIDGNAGPAPGQVRRSKGRLLGKPGVHYYSIGALVRTAERRGAAGTNDETARRG